MQAGQEFPEDPFLGPRAKKRNDVSDLKPGAIRLDVGPQRVCRGGSIAECDTKQDWREWVDVLTRILSRNVSRQSVRVSAADLTLDNGRVVYPRFGIGNPATGFGVFMPVGSRHTDVREFPGREFPSIRRLQRSHLQPGQVRCQPRPSNRRRCDGAHVRFFRGHNIAGTISSFR